MGRSNRPSVREMREVFVLAAECRELGADPLAWRRHLASGLCALMPDSIVLIAELCPVRMARGEAPPCVDCGWTSCAARACFGAYLESGEAAKNPMLNHIMRRKLPLQVMRASDIMPMEEWKRQSLWDYMKPSDTELDCVTTASITGNKRNLLTVHSHRGNPPPSLRRERLLTMLHRELAPDLGTELASFGEPSALELPLRVRQVLVGLIGGRGVKEIALELKMSRHTAADYTKLIHRHFDVKSRSELLVRLGGFARNGHAKEYILDDISARPLRR